MGGGEACKCLPLFTDGVPGAVMRLAQMRTMTCGRGEMRLIWLEDDTGSEPHGKGKGGVGEGVQRTVHLDSRLFAFSSPTLLLGRLSVLKSCDGLPSQHPSKQSFS